MREMKLVCHVQDELSTRSQDSGSAYYTVDPTLSKLCAWWAHLQVLLETCCGPQSEGTQRTEFKDY